MESGTSQQLPRRNALRGGLFRRFILPQILIIAAGSVLGIYWAGTNQRNEERKQLINVAVSNAQLVENQNLPHSARLASHLTIITGYKIGLMNNDGIILSQTRWSEAESAAAKLATQHLEQAVLTQGIESAAAPLSPKGRYLVAIQASKPLLTITKGDNLLPLAFAVALAVASAFLIARLVVRPLQQLAASSSFSSLENEAQLPRHLTERRDEIGTLSNALVQGHKALIKEQIRRRNSEKMALLGNLTTSLAHEIKNPASAIIMHARSLETKEQSTQGQLIREEGEQIVSLVNQWLFVAQPQAPTTSPTDLSDLLTTLKNRIQPLLDFHHCHLQLDTPETLTIDCDAVRIEQVFRNLIDNAIQAMPQGGNIVIKIHQTSENRLEFTVTDEGPGFSATALANFGETFYSEREGGMGLGLALVSGVIQAHHGSVSVKNHPDLGAIVSGTLPISPP